jgi:hypothetical protein
MQILKFRISKSFENKTTLNDIITNFNKAAIDANFKVQNIYNTNIAKVATGLEKDSNFAEIKKAYAEEDVTKLAIEIIKSPTAYIKTLDVNTRTRPTNDNITKDLNTFLVAAKEYMTSAPNSLKYGV